ncbi:MAG TPA: hypothetical protein VKH43_10140 [Thermoanaerobaculia bacterium]|nr:hypothetical protein [Thermoanaerobaculia bacterium]
MPLQNILAAAAISLLGLAPAPPQPGNVYRIEMAGGQIAWAQDQPRDTGTALLFHRHPDGLLVSVKKADVRRLSASAPPAGAARGPRPGKDLIVLGPTGAGSAAPAANGKAGALTAVDAGQQPGERKDGSALFNPDRKYKPEWDSKQVPGSSIGYPNSPNDYKEGKTFAYPPAGSTQSAPGELPRGPAGNGELPRGPGSV